MPPRRPVRTALAAVAVALLVPAAAACGDAGGLEGAGATPTAAAPDKLWPELTPASSPAFELGEVDTQVIKGITVRGGDIRAVDPVRVVAKEIASHPDEYADGKYAETARRMADCGRAGEDGSGDSGDRGRERCPVLRAYYRDLTGDGRDDLTLGFRKLPGNLTAVRVYTVRDDRLVEVMAYEDAVSGVELAGRSVIIRAPSEVAGYEYRLQWTWDPQQRAMLLTHDEMLRTGDHQRSPRPKRSSASPSSAGPSPSMPASGR
ncbi:hypothetical protein [Streptomyces sp. Amel2xC10]|uniref:hypothetical protein n=1 Tax=Streptomyces sp. Amel2xC10 TaxID=1305826 RepID=UPI000A085793|nr:hypothetical protein [Streptomyces sp. Amel2xC10]SMF54360.1 hypothetical protein SAMN02745830_04313 [Streptomyces sp. Amel2xC10]